MDRIYIANLPPNIRIMDIDDFFRPFGKLISIDVNHRANPVYAYVQFDSPRNAFNAVKSRHGYNYEGYTLLLRLAENEVRTRRDATPPPPPPPMFDTFDRQNNDGVLNNRMGGSFSSSSFQSSSQWSNNSRSGIQQYPSSNRPNMLHQDIGYSANNQQQNFVPYSNSGRSNIQQQFSNANFSNMQEQYSNTNISNIQQKYSNANLSNMQQQYSNSYRSNIQDQFSNSNRSDMSTQNMYSSRSDIPQQNINFSRDDRFNTPEQEQNLGMMRFSNNSAWNSNNMNWNSGNGSNNNGGPNVLNQYSDPYAQSDSDDHYTQGLSGSGRKWFNRYISQGFSKEMARKKALEHRTLPYLREGRNKNPADHPTNAALQTIGSTLISLLSNNTNDGSSSNFQIPGPSSSKPMTRQIPSNAVSKRQYYKSLDILKKIKGKSVQSNSDRISKKYHTQIVRDYEQLNHIVPDKKDRPTSISEKLLLLQKKRLSVEQSLQQKKQELLRIAKKLNQGKIFEKKLKGRYAVRVGKLIDEGRFSELEAKALAVVPFEKLKPLIELKKEYDMLSKKTDFIPANKKSFDKTPKIVVYHNDLKYLRSYEDHRISELSYKIIVALDKCIKRIHNYEKENDLPLTLNKFVKLCQKIALSRNSRGENNKASPTQKTAIKKVTKIATKTTDKVDEEKKVNDNTNATNKKTQLKVENVEDKQDNENITEEIIEIKDEAEEEEYDGNGESFEEDENLENEDDQNDENEEDQNE